MAQSGIFNILPTDYQLYLESMLPYMNEVPIGEEYFDTEMKDQIIDSTLTNYFNNNTGAIGEMDYVTDKYKMGSNDSSTGTGFNKLFNTLGSYNYKINPPVAGADPSVTVTDRYDWNPTYGNRPFGTLGYVDRGGKDVTTSMMTKHLLNQRPTFLGGSGFDFSNTAEMVGNYLGHRQSEGEGRNVNMTIPINNETFRNYDPNYTSQNTILRSDTGESNRNFSNTPRGAAGFNSGGIASFMI
jgi:hypothetical protein|tara:strand:+ start:45 stop:767 length:723 start_codon:yes stop_codon:yes gene_type:complete